jgi:hypothetical protein
LEFFSVLFEHATRESFHYRTFLAMLQAASGEIL